MNTESVSFNGQVAFIDADVADTASLIAQFQPGTEVHLLDSSQDAIAQITQVLAHRSHVSAVHILSHGSDGALLLGGKTVSDLSKYDTELKQWSSSLTSDADILLYGCDVAGDTKGKAFVNQLAQLTGADVAASDDLTGSSALGGDWMLEYSTGAIETAAMADAAYQGTLANFFVNSTLDVVNPNDNVLTLREAITAANTQAGTDNIFFSVNGTFTLTGGELGISSNVNIYGNGASFTTISGSNASRVFNVSSGNTVLLSGLTIANGQATRDYGGGISNSGSLTVQFCTFSNNSADDGGGISNRGTLTVNSSTFSRNSADDGGGISNSGTLTVNNSTFSGNSADYGGGISNSGTLTINSSTFNNSTAFSGGGISNNGTLTVNSSTFSNNSARGGGGGGGGIINLRTLTVNSSTFSNNSATGDYGGGGISNRNSLTATGSYFLDNQAAYGGGIATVRTSTLISNVISRNRASNSGGGIFNDGGTVRLQLNNISSNTAVTDGIDLFGEFISGNSPTNPFGFNVIGRGGGFSGILNGVNGDVILVP